jgi:hypothetical protein
LNSVLEETSGPGVPPDIELENKFIKLLLGTGEDGEALGTIQDAAAHGQIISPYHRNAV